MHLLYQLDYDEILYLDMDVIPVTDKNFFDVWDLKKGIAIMSEEWSIKDNNRDKHCVRSPLAKYWNAHALLGYGKEVFKFQFKILDKFILLFFLLVLFTAIYNDIFFIINSRNNC